MPRKILEDTVLSYFNDAPLPYAEMMLRLASGALKRRRQGQAVTPIRKARKQGNEKPKVIDAPHPV